MNVAGTGVAGFLGGLRVLIVILPLLAILILNNLGYFKSFSGFIRILCYIGIYVLALATEAIFAWTLQQDFPLFSIWLFGYMLFLVIVTFFLSDLRLKLLTIVKRTVGVVSIAVAFFIYFLTKTPEPYKNQLFEKELVKGLDLTLVSKDSLYNAQNLVIVGDTVAGFYTGDYVKVWVDGGPDHISSGYFIRSLKNSAFRYFIDTRGYSSTDYALNYSDSSIILGGNYGGNLIRRVYPDTTEAVYFAYNGPYFPTYNRLIYKNLQILSNHSRFLIFDEVAQKLLFDKPVKSLNTLLGNSLLFVDNVGKSPLLNCLDLEKLKIAWSQPISVVVDGMPARTTNTHDLYMTGRHFVVKGIDAAYVLERRTGSIKWKYQWQFPTVHENFAMIDSNQIYVSDGRLLKSYLMDNWKYSWQIKNAKLYGLYSQFVIASSIDDKLFIIIQKSSGKILKKIRRSDMISDLRFVGDYVLVKSGNLTAIYK